MRGRVKTYLVMGFLMIILNGLILYEIFAAQNFAIYDEGQFVEAISAFCYFFVAILTLFRGFQSSGLEQKLTWSFSITSLLFFVREVDLEDLNIPGVLISLGAGAGRDVFFITIYLLLILSILVPLSSRRDLKVKALLRSEVVVVVMIAGFLLIMGSIFEQRKMTAVEEILEMNGALLFLLAAIVHEMVPFIPRRDGPLRF